VLTSQTTWIFSELLLQNLLLKGLRPVFLDDNSVATFSSKLKETLCTIYQQHYSNGLNPLSPWDLCFFFWVRPLVPTYCRCREVLLHLIPLSDTRALGRTALHDGLARCGGLYLSNAQHSQETNIHAPRGIQTNNPSKLAAADLRLTPRRHWDWWDLWYVIKYITV
jgi:hypothetical protein